MTHFKVDIQLPLRFNLTEGGKIGEEIPQKFLSETYKELLELAGGINTTDKPIMGSWICPKTKRTYHDTSIVFSVLVESDDKKTITNVPKIKELQQYKDKLKERFKQHEIFMVATRCSWL
ncbi:MAG: hypothetical protein AABX05_01860 [Nanoarchaeota archaeon]